MFFSVIKFLNIASRTQCGLVPLVSNPKILKCLGTEFYNQTTKFSTCSDQLQKATPNVSSEGRIADFEDVNDLKDDVRILLVDVREPHEVKKTGAIPHSVNIPMNDLEKAFKHLSYSQFWEQYARNKPHLTSPIIFSCKSGKRSLAAMLLAMNFGFSNVCSYGGGFIDWQKNCGKIMK